MSYEKACYQKLDEPVLVWMGLEFGEVATSVLVGAAVAILSGFAAQLGFAGVIAGFGTGAALMAFFRSLRRGGPGTVFARLYRAGFLEWLPAGLRPSHLLPIPRHETRLRMSPVEGEPDESARRERRTFFGR